MIRVGFIGLGSQGGGMAARLIEMGLPTTLWARREASLEPYRESKASFALTPAELGASSDVVGICVVNDDDVVDVILRSDGVLAGIAPGSVIAVHSTVSLDSCLRIAKAAAERGVMVIDAPVSGGGEAAARGALAVMVGGGKEAVALAMPALQTFGDPIICLGPLGSGLLVKQINNTTMAASLGIAHDAIEAGKALGMDPEALGLALTSGSANSFAMGIYVQSGGIESLATHAGALLHKDVSLFDSLAEQRNLDAGVLLQMADHALDLLGHSRSEGGPARERGN
jgi:3-hydroxyisobutyrate dehydrogenase